MNIRTENITFHTDNYHPFNSTVSHFLSSVYLSPSQSSLLYLLPRLFLLNALTITVTSIRFFINSSFIAKPSCHSTLIEVISRNKWQFQCSSSITRNFSCHAREEFWPHQRGISEEGYFRVTKTICCEKKSSKNVLDATSMLQLCQLVSGYNVDTIANQDMIFSG